MALRSHREMKVWQRAMDLVPQVYVITESLPAHEQYGLGRLLQLAVSEVPLCIARGSGRGARRYFANCVAVALGALMELDTMLEITERMGYADKDKLSQLFGEIQVVSRLLARLKSRLVDGLSHGAGPFLED
jgi:four helix bundle protein